MVIYYIGDQTFTSDQLNFDPAWLLDNGGQDPAQVPTDLTVVNSSAYVSKVAPIPDASGFLMSRLYEDPKVLVVDFRDALAMSSTLDRISSFVEVNGKKKVDVTTSFTGEGMDLKLEDVADFYNQCLRQKIPITSGEQELLKKLEENGLIVKDENANFRATFPFALIGMSRSADIYKRRVIFVHEYSHAKYFVNPAFNAAVSDAWSSLASAEQRFLKGAMMASGWYASGEAWLMETEAQAHAIVPPLSEDGFVGTLFAADRNCSKPKTNTKQCEDFWSYTGDIGELLGKLHDKYLKISECRVPLLANWESANGMITSTGIPAHCSVKKIPDGNVDGVKPALIYRTTTQQFQQMPLIKDFGKTLQGYDIRQFEQILQDPIFLENISRPRISDEPGITTADRVENILIEIQQKLDARHKKKTTTEK